MKKRLLSLLAALALVLSLAVPAALAADGDTMLETVRVLGILSGDENGNLNLSASVTRAEFVKMMTAASTYKDSVGSSTASLFTDVKSGHWATGYIKLAVEQGWVTGYVDGSFRPDSTITLEEACTALLRLLGYDSGSLAGSFPDAQLSKSRSIGLLDDLSAVQGQTLTRQDCVTLFYNLLTCQNSAGAVYGTTIKSLSDKTLSGKVNAGGTALGGYSFADGVEILDVDDNGGYARIYPSRIAGVTLDKEDVRYYTLDESGDIDRLILNGVTGDTLDYVYVTSASSSSTDMNTSGTYRYLLDGQSQTLSGSTIYNVSIGGAALLYEDGAVKNFRQLEDVTLTELGDLYAMAGNRKYALAEDVQVLLKDSSGDFYATTLSEINAGDYTLTGWYDDLGFAAGGRIRIIIAVAD